MAGLGCILGVKSAKNWANSAADWIGLRRLQVELLSGTNESLQNQIESEPGQLARLKESQAGLKEPSAWSPVKQLTSKLELSKNS